MWMGLIELVESLDRKRLTSQEEEGILSEDHHWNQLQLFFESPVHQFTLQILNLPSLHNPVSQFLKKHFSLS